MRHYYPLITLLSLALTLTGTASAQRNASESTRSSQQNPENSAVSDAPSPETAKSLQSSALAGLSAWRHAAVREELEAGRDDFGTTFEFKTAWAYLLAEEKKLDTAIDQLIQVTAADTNDPVAPYYLGEIYSWKRKTTAAREAWEDSKKRSHTVLQKTPEDPEANYWMGAVQLKLGKISESWKYLQKAEKAKFSPALTNLQIGLYYSAGKQWKEAKRAFDRCIEADSGFAHAYYYRARVEGKLGKSSEMLADFDRFIKLAPDAREASVARALLDNAG